MPVVVVPLLTIAPSVANTFFPIWHPWAPMIAALFALRIFSHVLALPIWAVTWCSAIVLLRAGEPLGVLLYLVILFDAFFHFWFLNSWCEPALAGDFPLNVQSISEVTKVSSSSSSSTTPPTFSTTSGHSAPLLLPSKGDSPSRASEPMLPIAVKKQTADLRLPATKTFATTTKTTSSFAGSMHDSASSPGHARVQSAPARRRRWMPTSLAHLLQSSSSSTSLSPSVAAATHRSLSNGAAVAAAGAEWSPVDTCPEQVYFAKEAVFCVRFVGLMRLFRHDFQRQFVHWMVAGELNLFYVVDLVNAVCVCLPTLLCVAIVADTSLHRLLVIASAALLAASVLIALMTHVLTRIDAAARRQAQLEVQRYRTPLSMHEMLSKVDTKDGFAGASRAWPRGDATKGGGGAVAKDVEVGGARAVAVVAVEAVEEVAAAANDGGDGDGGGGADFSYRRLGHAGEEEQQHQQQQHGDKVAQHHHRRGPSASSSSASSASSSSQQPMLQADTVELAMLSNAPVQGRPG